MILIRTVQADEWSKLQTLNNEIFVDNHTYDPDLKRDWAISDTGKKYFQEIVVDKESCCFVAEDAGRLVGYIAASPKPIEYRNSKYLEIDNMGVIPEYRFKGIASELIEAVKVWAKEKGFDKLFVNSYTKNTTAINFYKKSGFSEIDVSLEMTM